MFDYDRPVALIVFLLVIAVAGVCSTLLAVALYSWSDAEADEVAQVIADSRYPDCVRSTLTNIVVEHGRVSRGRLGNVERGCGLLQAASGPSM